MRFPALAVLGALFVSSASFVACSKDEPKKTSTPVDASSPAYPIDPDLKLPQGLDPNAPMVPLIEHPATAATDTAPTETGDAAAGAVAAAPKGGKAQPGAAPVAAVPQGTIKLVSPGAAPRQKLRYRFAAGKTETLTEELRSSAKIEGPGMDRPDQSSPPIKMVMAVKPTAVTPDGDCRYEYKVTSADLAGDTSGLPPDGVAEVRKQLSGLGGFGGWVIVSSRGITKQTGDLALPQGGSEETMQLLAQFKQALRDITPPFPEEEVGKGAQWTRVTTMTGDDGAAATQKETYTLTDVTGDTGKLDVALEQSATPQTLPPGPGGIVRKIEQSGATGKELTLFDVTRIVPQMQTIEATSITVQSASRGQETQKVKFTLHLGVKISGTRP